MGKTNNKPVHCVLARDYGPDCILCSGEATVHHLKGITGGKKVQTEYGTVIVCDGFHRLINKLVEYDQHNEVIIDEFLDQEKAKVLIKRRRNDHER